MWLSRNKEQKESQAKPMQMFHLLAHCSGGLLDPATFRAVPDHGCPATSTPLWFRHTQGCGATLWPTLASSELPSMR